MKRKLPRESLASRSRDRLDRRIEALIRVISHETVALPFPPVQGSVEPESGFRAQTVVARLQDAKAEDIVCLDLHGKTPLADTMIIATGRSNVHVGAIADHVVKAFKDAGLHTPHVEGLPHCDWVLVDGGDIIVHVFRPEVRQFYNLEKMWGRDRPGERQTG
jgi:ribosome-associated protein